MAPVIYSVYVVQVRKSWAMAIQRNNTSVVRCYLETSLDKCHTFPTHCSPIRSVSRLLSVDAKPHIGDNPHLLVTTNYTWLLNDLHLDIVVTSHLISNNCTEMIYPRRLGFPCWPWNSKLNNELLEIRELFVWDDGIKMFSLNSKIVQLTPPSTPFKH